MGTLVIGLGRSGAGLHLPVLARARGTAGAHRLFAHEPPVTFDAYVPEATVPGTVRANSLTEATSLVDPARTVVHLCTPPAVRVEVLREIARLGFRKILVEKPLAIDMRHLAEVTRLRRQWDLALLVVAPWRVSALTRRIEDIVDGRTLGALQTISVVQRKPRFTRSLAGADHQSVFDVEAPHAVGLAVALAGSARVRDAAWTDMRIGDVVVPRMGTGKLSIVHDSGVKSELLSDLTSPTRERRITLRLDEGTLVGHYPSSEHDHTAQLTVSAPQGHDSLVFHDDALATFIVRAYEHFAAPGSEAVEPLLDAEVVRVLDDAKHRCEHRVQVRPLSTPGQMAPQRPRQVLATVGAAADRGAPAWGAAGGQASLAAMNGHSPPVGTAVAPVAPGGRESRGPCQPTIRWAGIGDEGGVSLQDQVTSLARLGWTSIELRTVDGAAVANLDDQTFARLADTLQTQGLAVPCIASAIGNWSRSICGDFQQDLSELDVLGRRCAVLETRYVRVMSYPNAGLTEREWGRRVVERMRRLAGRAEGAGIVLVHENCSGWAGRDAERMLALVDAVDSPALRLLFDTGNGVAHDYDTYDLLTQIVEHVAHVHVKDAKGLPPEPVYTLAGSGRARVAECLRLLLASGYTGSWSIEPHLAVAPHRSMQDHQPGTEAPSGADGRGESFVASGHALEQLVRDQVLPAAPGWTATPGGIVRRQAC